MEDIESGGSGMKLVTYFVSEYKLDNLLKEMVENK